MTEKSKGLINMELGSSREKKRGAKGKGGSLSNAAQLPSAIFTKRDLVEGGTGL